MQNYAKYAIPGNKQKYLEIFRNMKNLCRNMQYMEICKDMQKNEKICKKYVKTVTDSMINWDSLFHSSRDVMAYYMIP